MSLWGYWILKEQNHCDAQHAFHWLLISSTASLLPYCIHLSLFSLSVILHSPTWISGISLKPHQYISAFGFTQKIPLSSSILIFWVMLLKKPCRGLCWYSDYPISGIIGSCLIWVPLSLFTSVELMVYSILTLYCVGVSDFFFFCQIFSLFLVFRCYFSLLNYGYHGN